MSFASLRLVSLLSTSGLLIAACGGGGGAKTTQELGDRVLAALQAKDFSKVEALLLTPDLIAKNCPSMPAEELARAGEKFAKHTAEMKESFEKCGKIDWAGAKIVGTDGGEDRKPVKECTDVMKVRDLKLTVEVGGKKVKVKIDDPMRAGGALYLADEIKCDAGGDVCADAVDNVNKIAATSKDEDFKKMAADPSSLDMLRSMCQAEKDGPKRAMFECIATAATDVDMKACDKKGEPAPKDEPKTGDVVKPVDPVEAPAGGADKPADPPAGGAANTGAPNCDTYLKGMEACIAKMPEAAQGAVKDGIKQTQEAWKSITDKTALDGACKSALDAAKTAMGQMCPDVKWE